MFFLWQLSIYPCMYDGSFHFILTNPQKKSLKQKKIYQVNFLTLMYDVNPRISIFIFSYVWIKYWHLNIQARQKKLCEILHYCKKEIKFSAANLMISWRNSKHSKPIYIYIFQIYIHGSILAKIYKDVKLFSFDIF